MKNLAGLLIIMPLILICLFLINPMIAIFVLAGIISMTGFLFIPIILAIFTIPPILGVCLLIKNRKTNKKQYRFSKFFYIVVITLILSIALLFRIQY